MENKLMAENNYDYLFDLPVSSFHWNKAGLEDRKWKEQKTIWVESKKYVPEGTIIYNHAKPKHGYIYAILYTDSRVGNKQLAYLYRRAAKK